MMTDALIEAAAIRAWLQHRREAAGMQVRPGALARSRTWALRDGAIRHASGRFFQVVGLRWGDGAAARCQPFIEQREVGTLGFLVRQGPVGLELLLHAKAEPGNVDIAQIAPTCQATASNRDCVHGGTAPPYALQFADRGSVPLADSRQSEQGSRFLGKFNRNVVISSDAATRAGDDHCWASFQALKPLLLDDFLINTDARSVICTTPWDLLAGDVPFAGGGDLSRALRRSFTAPPRMEAFAQVEMTLRRHRLTIPPAVRCPVDTMPGWRCDPDGTVTLTDGQLALHHIEVRARSREVPAWDQPILDNDAEQVMDLDCRSDAGTLRFGFRAGWEPGLGAGAELAPSHTDGVGFEAPLLLQVRQSDEGGRFLRDVARYRIRDVSGMPRDDTLLWLSLSEVHALLPRGYFNNEARSAISLLLAFA